MIPRFVFVAFSIAFTAAVRDYRQTRPGHPGRSFPSHSLRTMARGTFERRSLLPIGASMSATSLAPLSEKLRHAF
jgi:hypothetical protein